VTGVAGSLSHTTTFTLSNIRPDTTPPVISGVSASAITTNGATITWTTNEPSDSQVDYGTSTSYGNQTTLNTSLVTSHSQTISGLSAATTYNFRVNSRDAAGNLATSSGSTFTTASTGGPPDLSTRAFTIVDRGGMSMITDGSSAQTAGYSAIVPDPGKTTPAGVAIFGFRNANNILVSETGVPATPLVSAGRIYAEVADALNTGIAIANRSNSAATISFSYTDASGAAAGSGMTTIEPNQQIAKFLNQAPFNVYPGAAFRGTFSFSSNAPVGVVALRGFTNERGDFLMSTLPVIDITPGAAASGTVVVPHFADGGGWITQILLVNPTDGVLTGSVQFTDQNGAKTNVTIAGSTGNTFRYAVPKGSSQKLATTGAGAMTASGSVQVIPDGGGTVPLALVVFSYRPAGVTVTEAGVPVTRGSAFRLYVESAGTTGQSGNIQTAIAVANTSPSPTSVTFDITDLNSAYIGISPFTLTLPGFGQAAKLLSDIFPALPNPFRGVVRITTTGPGISVAGLRARYNERLAAPDFLITTTPPTNEASPASTLEFVLPQIVNGGGYTTQFILFSGVAGQNSSGNLRFLKQDGSAFSLNVH
jgi:hypothetical protein